MPHKVVSLAVAGVLMLILGSFAQAALDLPYRLRFASPAANYWAVAALSLLVPILALLAVRAIPIAWLRRTGFVVAGLVALPCLVVSSCAMLEAPARAEADTSYELLSEAQAGPVTYRLYRTDCGATCAVGLDLREERDLPLGVKLVSPKWSLYRAAEGSVKLEQSAVLVVRGEDVIGRVAR